MALILCMDTSTETGSIALSRDGNVIGRQHNHNQKDHAGWIHTAIHDLCNEHHIPLSKLEAVAAAAGPGSYTGLRVAMSTAKGLCFSLNIPLVAINTLTMMAAGYRTHNQEAIQPGDLICPMIDARRMEVFTAMYSTTLEEVIEPVALVLDETSFSEKLLQSRIYFIGNGASKFRQLVNVPHAMFGEYMPDAAHLASLAESRFSSGQFDDLAYTAPVYVKGFFDTRSR